MLFAFVINPSPRRALSTLTTDGQAAWHLRYCPQDGLELRARATLARVESELRAAGAEVTIHALWVALAGWAGRGMGRKFNQVAQALTNGAHLVGH